MPLVASYHTHVPFYMSKMGLDWCVGGIWQLIKCIHRGADLSIAVSPKAATDLVKAGACDPGACPSRAAAASARLAPQPAFAAARAPLLTPTHPHHHITHPASIKVWPKAVDGERFSPMHASREMRQRLAGGPAALAELERGGGPLLLYVGRISSEKNVPLLRR